MHIPHFLTLASIIGLSQAYLPPPEISAAVIDITRSLIIHDVNFGNDLLVQLDYPRSPEPISEGKTIVGPAERVLELNFTLQHDDNRDKIQLNDHIIYPVRAIPEPSVVQFTAQHLIKNDQGKWEHIGDVNLGYSVNSYHSSPNMNHHSLEKVDTIVDIFDINGITLNRLLTIEFQLLQIPAGKLTIKNVIMKIPQTLTSKASLGPEECTTIPCYLKNSLDRMLSTTKEFVKSCQMSHHQEAPPQQDHEFSSSYIHPVAIGFLNSDKPKHGIFSHNIIVSSLIPVLAGMATGISVGILGVILGRMISYLRSIWGRKSYDYYACLDQIDVDNQPLDYENEKYQTSDPVPEYSDMVNKTSNL